MGLECGAFSVLDDDLDLVKPRPEVNFGEHSGTSHGVQALVYAGNGVHNFLGQRVEAAVVNAEAESAIVLLCEEHACAERGVGWLNPAIAGVLFQLGFEGFVLSRVHPVNPVTRGNSVVDQVDPVVSCSGGWEALRKVLGEDVGEARE